jgi:hypothetical protein
MNKYFYKYVNDNKWIQINGIGNDPENCEISWDCSKNNDDLITLEKNKTDRSPLYGWIKFDDEEYKNNIYAQVLKISPLIRDGYVCEKYEVPKVEPLLPDPQVIIPEKEEMEEKISINKSELSKAITVNAQVGEAGYIFIPKSYDKENRKFEDSVVSDLDEWTRDRKKNLKHELKDFYGELND